MEANIIFENVKAYSVTKFDVRLGETFKVQLVELQSNNEIVMVLQVEVYDNVATALNPVVGETALK
jgi:hypothetical protein